MLKLPRVLLVSRNGWKFSSSNLGSGTLKRPYVVLPWHVNPLCAYSHSELFCQMCQHFRHLQKQLGEIASHVDYPSTFLSVIVNKS